MCDRVILLLCVNFNFSINNIRLDMEIKNIVKDLIYKLSIVLSDSSKLLIISNILLKIDEIYVETGLRGSQGQGFEVDSQCF